MSHVALSKLTVLVPLRKQEPAYSKLSTRKRLLLLADYILCITPNRVRLFT